MRDPQAEIRKQLDAVVGESYEPPRRWGPTIGKWLVFAVAGIAMAVAVVTLLDVHVTKAQKDAAHKRPIPVHIIPAR
jgi:hypothetical protein